MKTLGTALLVISTFNVYSQQAQFTGAKELFSSARTVPLGSLINTPRLDAISADGTAVSGAGVGAAFIFKTNALYVDSVIVYHGPFYSGLGLSSDGSVGLFTVNGWRGFNGVEYFHNALLFSLPSDHANWLQTEYSDISNDGLVFAGRNGTNGFRQTPTGTNYFDGFVPTRISGDGNVVAGGAHFWSETTGIIGLGADDAVVSDLSENGSIIVGEWQGQAFRWNASEGIVNLGSLGGFSSSAKAVSAGGTVIVGSATTEGGSTEAFIWDAANGMRSLKSVLESKGIDLSGWRLDVATGISADGNVIIGNGNNSGQSGGWIAALSVSSTPAISAYASGGRANIEWEDVSGEVSYILERKTGTNWVEIARPSKDCTGFTDTTVQHGATYSYRIRSSIGLFESANSSEADVTIPELAEGDLVWRDSTGRIAAWQMSGTNFLGSKLFPKTASADWRLAGIADFNNDGKSDFLWKHSNGTVAIWFMDGLNFLGSTTLRNGQRTSADWDIAGIGDFNHDGKPDILWKNVNGRTAVWLMDQTNFISSVLLRDGLAVASGWRLVGSGDFNSDGNSDLLWQHSDGRLAVWFMNETNFVSSVLLRDGQPAGKWRAIGLSDFDGNGQQDILFQDAEKRLAVWFMDGTTFLRSGTLRDGQPVSAGWNFSGSLH